MGLSEVDAACCLRLSLGWPSHAQDVETAVALLTKAVEKLRANAPAWQYRHKTNAF
jgi:cysteine sulfinate desulfinase/cysteine desulfurase-like protein